MDIPFLLDVLQKKIAVLNNAKSQAAAIGDLESMNQIDKELFDTQNTLSQLNLLSGLTNVAAAQNKTAREMVAGSLGLTPDLSQMASGIINGYDISSYATDPLYERKIAAILGNQPAFASVTDIDSYIKSVVPSSPLAGAMVLSAVLRYSVDINLLMAMLEVESVFGTEGVGARTNNPGNVGNTDSGATRTYASWAEGVDAVASWLNRHRVSGAPALERNEPGFTETLPKDEAQPIPPVNVSGETPTSSLVVEEIKEEAVQTNETTTTSTTSSSEKIDTSADASTEAKPL